VLGGLAIAGVGGFVLWMQAGLAWSAVNLAAGGYGLQANLSSAADGLTSGDYAAAQQFYEQAEDATVLMQKSVDIAPFELAGRIPGVGTAIENWRLSVDAASALTQATGDLITLYGDLSGKGDGPKIFSDGAIDLAMLESLPDRVESASAQVSTAHQALVDIRATTLPAQPLDRIRLKALEEMLPVEDAMGTLESIAPVLPDALGANGPRRYLIAIGNQAEMRASGGAPLNLIMVEFNEGRISIPIKGPTSTQLFPPLNAPVEWWGPGANPFFATNPRNAPFVVTNTHPNLLFSAREMAEAWVGGNYPRVDGVITLDLTAIAAVLDATGPIESEVYGTVDGERLGQILLVEAYQQFGQEGAVERQEANQDLLNGMLDRLLGGEDLVNAAQAITSTAPGRHFQAWLRNPELERLAMRAGAAGQVDDPGVGDWSAVYTQNGNQSKVDVFQQRNVLVTVNMAEDGSARVTQQVTLTNATPPDRPEGPPERVGYETSWLKNAYILYVPDQAQDFRASYPSGFAVRPFKNHPQLGGGWVDDGFGHRMIRLVGWTPPGGQNAVSVSYTLPAGTFRIEDGQLAYELHAEPQALFIPSTLSVTVTPPPGWTPVEAPGQIQQGTTATVSAVQDAPVDVTIRFTR
jgi:hypothetical protein